MKTLFAVLVSTLIALNSYGAVSGTVPGSGGGGSGSSTNAFTTLINLSTVGIPVLTNYGVSNLAQRWILGTNGITVQNYGGSNVLIGLSLATNDVTFATNSFAIDTVQTNTTTNILYTATSLLMTPTATEGVRASLVIEPSAGAGTWVTIDQVGEAGSATFILSTNTVAGFVAPGARFYITNQSIGSATAAVSIGYREYLIFNPISGGGGTGNGTVTGITNIGNGYSLINDSNAPIFILKSLTNYDGTVSYTNNFTNLNISVPGLFVLSNSITVVSNGLVILSNSIPALSNAIVGGSNFMHSISNGLLVLSNSIVPLSNALVGLSNYSVALSNGLGTVSNGLTLISNAQVVISNGLGTVSNGVVVISNGMVAYSNAMVAWTNNMRFYVNNTELSPPIKFTNSATVTIATNANGDIRFTSSGGGGSSFPLSADADVGGFALTNIYTKPLTFTAAHTLVASESGIMFNNIGATTRIDFTLPAPTVGAIIGFACMDADGLRVLLPAGTSLIHLSSLTTSDGTGGGYIDTATIGNTVILHCISATQWVAVSITGGGPWTTN